MNTTETNSGGWESSNMRSNTTETGNLTIPDIRDNLSTNLKNVIKTVKKGTYKYEAQGTLDYTNDDLWLLSEWEVCGYSGCSVGQEGTQYAYYVSHENWGKLSGGPVNNWWLRSPSRDSRATKFCAISDWSYDYLAVMPYGVAPGFCV